MFTVFHAFDYATPEEIEEFNKQVKREE